MVQFLVNISKKFKASPYRLDLTFPGIGVLCEGWPLRSHLEAGPCDPTWRLALAIPPGGWPLQSHLEAGPCDPTWRLALAIPTGGWPLGSHLEAGPCVPSWRLALAIPPGGWPSRSYLEAGPCDPTWRLDLAIPAICILPGIYDSMFYPTWMASSRCYRYRYPEAWSLQFQVIVS